MEENNFSEEEKISKIVILVDKYQNIIRNLYLHIQNQKNLNIIKQSDVGGVIDDLNLLMFKCDNTVRTSICLIEDYNELYDVLQSINDSISTIMKQYGCLKMDELLFICYSGTHLVNNLDDNKKDLYNDVFNKYFVPIGYKTIQLSSLSDKHGKKTNNANSIFEDFNIAENANTLDIFDLGKQSKDSFILKMNGVKIVFRNDDLNETLIMKGYFRDQDFSILEKLLHKLVDMVICERIIL